jgi:hypothetical protein
MTSPYQPYPQPAPYAPGAMAPLAPPESVRRAVGLILTGSVLAVVGGIVGGMTAHSSTFFSYGSTTSSGVTVHQSSLLFDALFGAALQCALWLWMAWKIRAGRQWARVLSTVFFGITCVSLLATAVMIGLPGHFGARLLPGLLITLAQFGVGLAAIIFLYRPESSGYFAIALQSEAADTYARTQAAAAAWPGGSPTGYGQPPQPYGQPAQYGQPPQPPQ